MLRQSSDAGSIEDVSKPDFIVQSGRRGATDTSNDGAIVFNSSFAWDFDLSGGITPGTLDVVGIATHEIGHTLGFESGVDDLDALFNTGGLGGIGTGTQARTTMTWPS